MYKLIFFFLFWSFGIAKVSAQTTDLGEPQSWSIKTNIATPDYHLMPTFDLKRMLKEDEINQSNGIKTWRFGFEHNVNYGLQNSGTWTTLSNGDRLWQIELESKGALSMNLVFDNFNIPQGALLYLYNPLTKNYIGAYTAKNNNPDGMLGSSLLAGANIIVEYYEPADVAGLGQVNISMVVHGYKSLSLYPHAPTKSLNSSGDCNIDVACPLGVGWEDQINSVALVIVGGSGNCTGALINNTSSDGTPYFLSANHCGTTGLGAWVFRFNWDSPVAVCAATTASTDPGAPYNDINGATLKANNPNSDFALMELNATPTGNIYYAGWNRDTVAATSATGIHHPRADVKKICRENDPLTKGIFGSSSAQVWTVNDWDAGVTEGGSSGSPLFDQNHLIIGQLYGGGAACTGTTDNGQSDNYGRLEVSWNGSAATSRLKDWLDPSNTGLLSVAGYNPNGPGYALDAGIAAIEGIDMAYCNVDSFMPQVRIRNFGSDTISSVQIIYNIDSLTNIIYNWTGTLLPHSLQLVSLPTLTTTAGTHIFNAWTDMPNNSLDSNSTNNARSFSFNVVLNGEELDYTLIMDCYGDEISWKLRDSITNIVLYQGGSYSNSFNNIDTIQKTFCVNAGCYSFTIYDSYGDGLDGTASAACGRFGNYWIKDALGHDLVMMTAVNGNFGDSAVYHFCVPYVVNSQTPLEQVAAQFKVYPNPTSGELFINFKIEEQTDFALELYNATGQLLQSITSNTTSIQVHSFDMSSYSAGMYFVKLRVGERVFVRKAIKH